ncbi:MAG: hypothetical protein CFE50_05210 [Pseudomonas sp. PGPPP4]|uniref:hypothetical protein n=1 Tax=Pseudomonas sp. PGPPP4 TaxID=2015556 RepID=UPI000BD7EE5E|nr:hypothetical protein [Pseudomonas sp. PGPPP4]OYT85429.1 MAG: hypothetical protein CFE50_05210 [Pseudomonas sp. PGPPP4]
MKRLAAITLTALLLGLSQTSMAAGCIKGAVAGGVAGHFAGHHAIAGAVAGCAIGHHLATKAKEEQQHPHS